MTDQTRKTCGKIKSAKHWLTKAEQHIVNDSSMRGQLDLLLAEAELKSVQESLRSKNPSNAYLAFQHFAALSIALLLVVGVLSYSWNNSTENKNAVEQSSYEKSSAVILSGPRSSETLSAQAVQVQKVLDAKVESNSAASMPETRQVVNGSTQPANKETVLTPDEMQRLIRTAGQSLRGQSKP